MAMTTAPGLEPKAESHLDSKIKRSPGKVATGVFGVVLAAGLIYAGSQLVSDVSHVHTARCFPSSSSGSRSSSRSASSS